MTFSVGGASLLRSGVSVYTLGNPDGLTPWPKTCGAPRSQHGTAHTHTETHTERERGREMAWCAACVRACLCVGISLTDPLSVFLGKSKVLTGARQDSLKLHRHAHRPTGRQTDTKREGGREGGRDRGQKDTYTHKPY